MGALGHSRRRERYDVGQSSNLITAAVESVTLPSDEGLRLGRIGE